MLQFILKYGEIFKVDEYSHKARIYLQYLFLWLNLYAECLSIGLIIAVLQYKKKYVFQNYITANLTHYYFISNNTNYNFLYESKSNNISSK